MLTCSNCKVEKPTSEFTKDKYSKSGFTHRCKQCRNDYYNEYYKRFPEKVKERNERNKNRRDQYYKTPKGVESNRKAHLKRMFGITLDDYNKMLSDQNHVCAICGEKEKSERYSVMSVDHCHKEGHIRGLLCHKCNKGLGCFRDTIEFLYSAINYLSKNGKKPKSDIFN